MKSPARWIVVALSLAAAFGFSIAVQAIGWWSAGEVSFGPFGAHDCFGGECRTTGLSWLGGTDLWMRSAVATRVAGFILVATSIMLAGAVAARRVPRLIARMTIVALATAILAAAYFVVRCPDIDTRAIGMGLPLFGAAIACAIGAVALVLRTPQA